MTETTAPVPRTGEPMRWRITYYNEDTGETQEIAKGDPPGNLVGWELDMALKKWLLMVIDKNPIRFVGKTMITIEGVPE